MNVCQRCGTKGKRPMDIVLCAKCRVSAVHRYCMTESPNADDKELAWTCEDCTPQETKISEVPARKSERVSEAAQLRLNRVKKLEKTLRPKKNTDTKAGPDKSREAREERPTQKRRRAVLEDTSSYSGAKTGRDRSREASKEGEKPKRRRKLIIDENSD